MLHAQVPTTALHVVLFAPTAFTARFDVKYVCLDLSVSGFVCPQHQAVAQSDPLEPTGNGGRPTLWFTGRLHLSRVPCTDFDDSPSPSRPLAPTRKSALTWLPLKFLIPRASLRVTPPNRVPGSRRNSAYVRIDNSIHPCVVILVMELDCCERHGFHQTKS
jgi:hypothetical protein